MQPSQDGIVRLCAHNKLLDKNLRDLVIRMKLLETRKEISETAPNSIHFWSGAAKRPGYTKKRAGTNAKIERKGVGYNLIGAQSFKCLCRLIGDTLVF